MRKPVHSSHPSEPSSGDLPLVLRVLALLLLGGLTLAYSNHFDNGFYFDDHHTITTNESIRSLSNLPRFFSDVATFSSLPANQGYRPVVTTLNAIDYWIAGGLDPFYFHLSMYFWYVVLLALVYVFLSHLMRAVLPHRWTSTTALFATAFYGFHASNAETLNYIISRSDSFSTLCVVASLVLYQKDWSRRYHLYLLTMVLGILTKQTGVMFVPLLLAYIVCVEHESWQPDTTTRLRLARAAAPVVPAAVIAVTLFLFNQFYMTHVPHSNTTVSRVDYLLTQSYVISHYLANFAAPLWLSADPDIPLLTSVMDPRVLLGLATIFGLLAISFAAIRNPRTRPISFGILWFFIALAPTSSFVRLYQLANDHRMFMPNIGLALAASWGLFLLVLRYEHVLRRVRRWQYAVVLFVLIVLGGHAWGIHQRNEVWNTPESLWLDVTRKSPENGRGHMNYSRSLMARGDYEGALTSLRRAEEMVPTYSYLHLNKAVLHHAMGAPASEVERHFDRARSLDPLNPSYHAYYGRWLHGQGRLDESVETLQAGVTLSPTHAPLREALAAARHDQRQVTLSRIKGMQSRIRANPTPEGYIELGLAYYQAGMMPDCIAASDSALALRPDYAIAYNNKCSAYNRLGEWQRAVEACEKALEIDPGFTRASSNLDWARREIAARSAAIR